MIGGRSDFDDPHVRKIDDNWIYTKKKLMLITWLPLFMQSLFITSRKGWKNGSNLRINKNCNYLV